MHKQSDTKSFACERRKLNPLCIQAEAKTFYEYFLICMQASPLPPRGTQDQAASNAIETASLSTPSDTFQPDLAAMSNDNSNVATPDQELLGRAAAGSAAVAAVAKAASPNKQTLKVGFAI